MTEPAEEPLMPTGHAPRILVIDGDREFSHKLVEGIKDYFESKSLPIKTDWTPSIEHSLLQMKYYDYDLAVAGYRPAEGESGFDLIELMEKRGNALPVIILADINDRPIAEMAIQRGAADFFVKEKKTLTYLPRSVEKNIVKFHASKEYRRLNREMLLQNQEMKSVNSTLARQTVRFLKLKQEHETERRKMEKLLNSMVGGVVFINSKKEIGMTNPAARKIFRIDDNDSKFNLDDLRAFIGFNPFEMDKAGDMPAVIFSREYAISTTPIEEDGLHGTGRMVFLHDVTKEREVERLKAEFQSMISHELRTPLTAIKGAVENFMRGNLGEITDQQKTFLEMIGRNVDRQTELINDMLDLAKLEAKMMSLNVSNVNPEYIARLSYESFQYALKEKGVSFLLEFDDGLPEIMADGRMVSQVLDNLLSNALKFTPQNGSVKLEVRKGYEGNEEADSSVIIRVSDTGPGVPDDRKEKIFDRYYQMDSGTKRTFKGTGLGLSISRKMASLHSGTVVCTDSPEGGARFTITLPIKMAARKAIMIIGDDNQQTKLDEEILGKEFRLVTLNGGGDAVRLIGETLPQLVLLDYHITGMNGFEIFSRMKQNGATAEVPVIFVSENMTEEEKIQALKLGAADIVTRPYNVGEFLARVKRVIDQQI